MINLRWVIAGHGVAVFVEIQPGDQQNKNHIKLKTLMSHPNKYWYNNNNFGMG